MHDPRDAAGNDDRKQYAGEYGRTAAGGINTAERYRSGDPTPGNRSDAACYANTAVGDGTADRNDSCGHRSAGEYIRNNNACGHRAVGRNNYACRCRIVGSGNEWGITIDF